MKDTIVWFDLETSGLDPDKHEIIQIAAVVRSDGQEVDSLELKVHFDIGKASREALDMNSFIPGAWDAEAVLPTNALRKFASFIRPFATVDMISKRGQSYKVARLGGHSSTGFDMPFLKTAYRRANLFLPAAWLPLDTLQAALWYFIDRDHRPKNLKLSTLASFFDLPEPTHDALADARTTAALAERLQAYSTETLP